MPEAMVFVSAMLAGMAVEHLVARRRASIGGAVSAPAVR